MLSNWTVYVGTDPLRGEWAGFAVQRYEKNPENISLFARKSMVIGVQTEMSRISCHTDRTDLTDILIYEHELHGLNEFIGSQKAQKAQKFLLTNTDHTD